jgi:hypothetical protein
MYISRDMSQVGVALFPSFYLFFNRFTSPGFPFIKKSMNVCETADHEVAGSIPGTSTILNVD